MSSVLRSHFELVGEREREWVDLSGAEDPLVREYVAVRTAPVGQWGAGGTEVKKEEDTAAQRQKSYAAHARRFNEAAQSDIRVPQWVVFGALAAMVGVVVLSNRGAQRWK